MGKTEDNAVKKVTDSLTKDLPKLVKRNNIGCRRKYNTGDQKNDN